MKKMMALLLCALLFIGLIGCTAPVDDTDSTTTTTNATDTTTTAAPTSPTSATLESAVQNKENTNWEGVGGGYGGSYVYVNGMKHQSVNFFSQYIYENYTEAELQAFVDKIDTEFLGTPYAYTGNSLQRRIIELNIPREKIEELNEISKEFYKDDLQYDEYVYTDEEINDMYTLTIEQYNQKYKAPTAAIIGAVLFPFSWFVDNPVETWQQYDFTVEQIQDVLDNGKIANFPEQYIRTFEEKLEEYIEAVTE